MASYSGALAVHKTLSGGTADAVTLTGGWAFVEVLNRAAAGGADIYFTNDGTAANVAGPDTYVVPAGSALKVASTNAAGSDVVNVVGAGNAYSVTGYSS